MSNLRLAQFTLLPELELIKSVRTGVNSITFFVKKTSEYEVCPGCATIARSVYDHRVVTVKDAPIRATKVFINIKKRRFLCKNKTCGKVFVEPIKGVSKGKRFTERFRRHLFWCAEKFSNLKEVRSYSGCSYGYLYKTIYEHLERRRREYTPNWPKTIGIDEHSFKKNKKYGYTEFATVIVDHKKKKVIELVDGKSKYDLIDQTKHFQGKEKVEWVTMDLCPAFRSFVNHNFPNAKIVADKFHVVRLLDLYINVFRKKITGDNRKNPIRKLLLKNSKDLDYTTRSIIQKWLKDHPKLKELYDFKQAIHRLYRTKGLRKVERAFKKLVDAMGYSKIPEVQRTRKTLLKWKSEILNYFQTRLTNARVEGFNNKAKLIKRAGYGYRSFRNYRLRVLNACR